MRSRRVAERGTRATPAATVLVLANKTPHQTVPA